MDPSKNLGNFFYAIIKNAIGGSGSDTFNGNKNKNNLQDNISNDTTHDGGAYDNHELTSKSILKFD